MEILVILAIIIAIIWITTKREIATTRKVTTEMEIPKPNINISTTAPSSSSFDNLDTSSVTATHDGGWVLNPKSTFPLTVYGIDRVTAEELKKLLDSESSILHIVTQTKLRCKEIDDYNKEFRPQYLDEIENLDVVPFFS